MFGLPAIYLTIAKWVGLFIVCASIGGWIAYKVEHPKVVAAQNALVAKKNEFDAYRNTVQSQINAAVAKSNAENAKLQSDLAALNAKHDADQKQIDADSAALLSGANHAKPADIRPIGPVATKYLSDLKAKQSNAH